MIVKTASPLIRALRYCETKAPKAPVPFTGQTPTSFVHDGWANARTPFNLTNKWRFTFKALAFLTVGFWTPFAIVEHQLRKANQ